MRKIYGRPVLANLVLTIALVLTGVSPVLSDPASNKIFSLKVVSDEPNEIKIEVDYFYNGEDGQDITLGAVLESDQEMPMFYQARPVFINVFKGRNTARLKFRRHNEVLESFKTERIRVFLASYQTRKSVDMKIEHLHEWPSLVPDQNQLATDTEYQESVLNNAIILIDTNNSPALMQEAEKKLKKLISVNPRMVRAYIELARLRMKTDGQKGHENSDGVLQAERLLKVALRIDPEYADTYVLLGYVYAVKGQTQDAKAVLKKAEQLGTKNLWLYYNWALAHKKENDKEGALQMYLKGINSPINLMDLKLKSHNRAVPYIFEEAIQILEDKQDWNTLEVVHNKRTALLKDYCSKQSFARFLVLHRSRYQEALALSEMEPVQSCKADGQLTLAIGYLAKWSDKQVKISDADRQNLYYKAIASMPDIQVLLSTMASSEYMENALASMRASNLNIDEKDVNGFTALAYSVGQGDVEGVKRLMRHGASLKHRFSNNWTFLMLAAQGGSEKMVRFLLSMGQKKEEKEVHGLKAADIAKLYGHPHLVRLLSNSNV